MAHVANLRYTHISTYVLRARRAAELSRATAGRSLPSAGHCEKKPPVTVQIDPFSKVAMLLVRTLLAGERRVESLSLNIAPG